MPFTIEHKQVPVSSCCGKKVSPPIPAIHNKELDEAIAYYKAMAAAAKSEKEKWEGKLSKLDDIAKESSLVTAKNEILAAMRDIDTYALLTDEELEEIINSADDEDEDEPEPSPSPAPAADNRPRIEAYNSDLDVRVNLRRTAIDEDYATWEDGNSNLWYTPAAYALHSPVWDTLPTNDTIAWGEVDLIDE